jgi:hypothetical protein
MTIYKMQGDKKMAKKYSSFKQQHMITESFRKYINEEDELESLISYLDPKGRKGVYDIQQAIASGTKIEFADDSTKTDLLQLSADVDAKVDLDLGDYWEFVEPEYLRKYTEEYDNAREALDRDYMDEEETDPGQFNEADVYDDYDDDLALARRARGSLDDLDDEQEKMVTYWATRAEDEDIMQMDSFHDDMRKLRLDPWTIYDEKIKSAQVQKEKPRLKYGDRRHSGVNNLTTGGLAESKVRFTKRQLQKIIKEEIKKVTKKKK